MWDSTVSIPGRAGGFKNSEPLKAAAGALSRPRKTIVGQWHRISWRLLPQLPILTCAAGFRRVAELRRRLRDVFSEPSHSTSCITANLCPRYCRSCQTLAASPAEPGGLPCGLAAGFLNLDQGTRIRLPPRVRSVGGVWSPRFPVKEQITGSNPVQTANFYGLFVYR